MEFDEDLNISLKKLKEGGVILYPTDTIWGLGCDATSSAAVENIFRIKSRAESKSLIILVNGVSMLERYVREVPAIAYELIDVSDNPISIIYPAGKNLASGICSEDGSVGIRICRDEFCQELIKRFRKPIVSTSANFSGKRSPSNFREIDERIISSVDYVVKHRQDERQKLLHSPVIKVDPSGVIKIIRN
jgi:L-threonylcarbamoyladenylate synthase